MLGDAILVIHWIVSICLKGAFSSACSLVGKCMKAWLPGAFLPSLILGPARKSPAVKNHHHSRPWPTRKSAWVLRRILFNASFLTPPRFPLSLVFITDIGWGMMLASFKL